MKERKNVNHTFSENKGINNSNVSLIRMRLALDSMSIDRFLFNQFKYHLVVCC